MVRGVSGVKKDVSGDVLTLLGRHQYTPGLRQIENSIVI